MKGAPNTRCVRVGGALAGCAVAVVVTCSVAASRNQASGALEGGLPVAIETRTATLEKELQLAATSSFYLVVDLMEGRLRLMLEGVDLSSYRILGAELGRPRIGFVSVGPSQLAEARVWEGGRLAPERLRERREVVVTGGTGKKETASSAPPPPPEVNEPVPDEYRVLYDGLVLDIVSQGEGFSWIRRRGGRLLEMGQERVSALRREPARLRLVLVAEDAAALYRCLPPGTRLLTPGLESGRGAPSSPTRRSATP